MDDDLPISEIFQLDSMMQYIWTYMALCVVIATKVYSETAVLDSGEADGKQESVRMKMK